MKQAFLLTIAFALASFTAASADTMVGVTTRTGADSVNWSQLGAPESTVSNPFSATSAGGVGVTGSFAGGGTGVAMQEGNDWFGNFAIGDNLVWTNDPGQGPLTFVFSKGLLTVGMQIQANWDGAFTAVIDAYNGNTLLGSFTELGIGNANEDNSAIYLGILDTTGANINRIVISLSNCSQDCAGFGVNQMSLTAGATPPPAVPEPSSVLLFGSGLLGVAGAARRRFLNI